MELSFFVVFVYESIAFFAELFVLEFAGYFAVIEFEVIEVEISVYSCGRACLVVE